MMELNRRRFIQGVGALFEWDALRGGGCAFAARSYTFYMFYTDKSNGQSKGEKPIIH